MIRSEICPMCCGQTVEKEVTRVVSGSGGTATLQVQAEVCLECGERLYSPETVRHFEKIKAKLEGKKITDSISYSKNCLNMGSLVATDKPYVITSKGDLIENPHWDKIEAAINELDGKSKTLITLGVDDETYMTIGGGKLGKYIVSVTFDNINFHNLVDLSQPDVTEKLIVGGQEGIYPAKMCVDLLPCLLAARTFAESGKLDSLLVWQEDESLVAV